jgi:hypothetical protein
MGLSPFPALLEARHEGPYSPVPVVGEVISVTLSLATVTVLAVCLSERLTPLRECESVVRSIDTLSSSACADHQIMEALAYYRLEYVKYNSAMMRKDVPLIGGIADVFTVLLLVYADSFIFVVITGILSKGFDMNLSLNICRGAILLCK